MTFDPWRAFAVWYLQRPYSGPEHEQPRIVHLGIRWDDEYEPAFNVNTWNRASKVVCGLAAKELAGIEKGWRSRWDAFHLPPPGSRLCRNCEKGYERLERRLGIGTPADIKEPGR
jgi:hypothetical protein